MWIPCYVYWFIKEREKNVMNKNMRKMFTEEEIGKLGGTKLYKHEIKGIGAGGPPKIIVYDNDSSKITISNVVDRINNSISAITASSKITYANTSGSDLRLVIFNIIPPSSVNTLLNISNLSGYTDDIVTPL